jgi:hypothetical protein
MRVQERQGRHRDDAGKNVDPVFPQHDREVFAKLHERYSKKAFRIIGEWAPRSQDAHAVVIDSGLAPPKSAVADLGTIKYRSQVNPRSVARPGMTAGRVNEASEPLH